MIFLEIRSSSTNDLVRILYKQVIWIYVIHNDIYHRLTILLIIVLMPFTTEEDRFDIINLHSSFSLLLIWYELIIAKPWYGQLNVNIIVIKKAVSHPFINASISEVNVDRVMCFILVEFHLMGTEFWCWSHKNITCFLDFWHLPSYNCIPKDLKSNSEEITWDGVFFMYLMTFLIVWTSAVVAFLSFGLILHMW